MTRGRTTPECRGRGISNSTPAALTPLPSHERRNYSAFPSLTIKLFTDGKVTVGLLPTLQRTPPFWGQTPTLRGGPQHPTPSTPRHGSRSTLSLSFGARDGGFGVFTTRQRPPDTRTLSATPSVRQSRRPTHVAPPGLPVHTQIPHNGNGWSTSVDPGDAGGVGAVFTWGPNPFPVVPPTDVG